MQFPAIAIRHLTFTQSLRNLSAAAIILCASVIVKAEPLPIFPDANLQTCVDEIAISNNWQEAEDITEVICSNKSIEQTYGLELLSNLNELDLSNNDIDDIYSLSSLQGLTKLNLSGNSEILIDDVIQVIQNNPGITEVGIADIAVTDYPIFFASLRNNVTGEYLDLTSLNLSNTGLTDTYELAQFIHLTQLNISDNQIEHLIGLSDLTQLTQIDASNNKLTYIYELQDLTNLTHVNLSNNPDIFFGDIYTLISNNPNIVELSLAGLTFDETAPILSALSTSNMGQPLNLTSLDLSNTGVVDTYELMNFPLLTSLNLSDNHIEFPAGIENLVQLTSLNLSNNKLIDLYLPSQVNQLTELDISGNRLLDINQVMMIINNNPNLIKLGIADITINDSAMFFSALQNMYGEYYSLTNLNLSNTELADPFHLTNFPELKAIDISNNPLIGLYGFEQLTQIQQLNANHIQLMDLYPIMHLTGLTALHLSGNSDLNITDIITLIEQNPNLTELSLGDIQIDDFNALFQALTNNQTGNYYNLTHLDLSNTGLNDTYMLSNFPNLVSLDISNNQIEYPVGLEALTQLRELNINNNPLKDVYTLLMATGLTQLDLSGNSDILIDDVIQIIQNNPGITEVGIADIAVTDYPIFFASLRNNVTGEYLDLTSLNLSNTGLMNTYELRHFPNLSSLNVSNNDIEFLDGFNELPLLTQIDVSNNNIFDIFQLKTKTNLTHVNLSGNPDIRSDEIIELINSNPGIVELGLAGIPFDENTSILSILSTSDFGQPLNLTSLDLSDTGLRDVYELMNFPLLTSLNLSNNPLTNLAGLLTSTNLKTLNLIGNEQLLCSELDLIENTLITTHIIRPLSCDTDGDGYSDNIDAFPNDPTEYADNDQDSIGNNADQDDDNDGMTDEWELLNLLNPFDATDANLDTDMDGLTNKQEFENASNPNAAEPLRPSIRTGVVSEITENWTTVDLNWNFRSMVVVATPLYTGTHVPTIVRIRNAEGGKFEVRAARADGSTDPIEPISVHYVAIEEGSYNDTEHGVTMEAVKYTSTITDNKSSWVGEARSYQNTYTSPVVIGQVMTENDDQFSVFWSRGSNRKNAPNSSNLHVGIHTGEDANQTRVNETIGYIVIEAGEGNIEGNNYQAAVGTDTVAGITKNQYSYNLNSITPIQSALVSQTAMDGNNGGWAVLTAAPTSEQILIAIDEDQLKDNERIHTTEQCSYIVFH